VVRQHPRLVSVQAMAQFGILGPLEVAGASGQLSLPRPKQRAILALLLLDANRVVSVDRLTDKLYGGDPPLTAVAQVHRQISELRKTLGEGAPVETVPPGYILRVLPEDYDLFRFERLRADAGEATAAGRLAVALDLLRQALALWRGAPLADVAEPFARTAALRLEEIRLGVLEERIRAELVLGRHAAVVEELAQLSDAHPLRERLHEMLMIALYRGGRQIEALDVYRRVRARLTEEFGVEPTPALRDLERAVLAHDATLDVRQPRIPTDHGRVALVVAPDDNEKWLLGMAEACTGGPASELLVVRVVADPAEVAAAARHLEVVRQATTAPLRLAAFATRAPAADVVRFAQAYDVELVILEADCDVCGTSVPPFIASLFENAPCHVAVARRGRLSDISGYVCVPFGGGEHDWAALEVAAQAALVQQRPVRLVGRVGPSGDASLLLADASLAVQRAAGVAAEPVLVEGSEPALLSALADAASVFVGVSPRWRSEGIGSMRRSVLEGTDRPVVLVHRGRRPGALAPRSARTRFTWSLAQ
jgi:DNA-binding SARP family transcriptional activator